MGAAVHCADCALRESPLGGAPPRGDPLAFLPIPIVVMVPFATFVTAALVLRRKKGMHKRLMLLAYISIIIGGGWHLPGVPVRRHWEARFLSQPPRFMEGLGCGTACGSNGIDFLNRTWRRYAASILALTFLSWPTVADRR